ncbi:Magnesium protoporphyrin IX methyltransferase [Hibiscus syriacus]|uniref:Magnesium protoporphyrin IX methyltransferase n=1 Tax=Hibiscus syriacus TaxID=106335 RepID=A0A6A2ZSX9_HIBSY|nr:Magnesium protoporphyrin IX methyltransferase [Hibiscus syriacus]
MAYSASLTSHFHFHTNTRLFSTFPPKLPTKQKATVTTAAIPPLSTAASVTDLSAEEVGGGDKEVVRNYFNNSGFQRWKKIYGETDDVNKVQLDIRLGHSKTVENVMKMLTDDGSLKGVTVCDAGCGTGCLAIPLAKEGAVVSASDISAAMVAEAKQLAKEQLAVGNGDIVPVMPNFEVKDLESLEGKYDTVVCLDVLIHYPQSKADGMIAHLASLAENRLILSFAPKTFYYDLLKRIGELFPGPSKATRAYLHAEADVERALNKVGWKIRKSGLITTQFYFARLVEAVPA